MKSDILKKAKKLFVDKKYRSSVLDSLGAYDGLSDEEYLKKRYRANFGRELDLSNPTTFNEKIQWLKLNDRKPIYTIMVDKYEVKKYVGDRIGSEYIIPTLGVWEHFDEIDFEVLPEQFVLKCTHDSGGIVIVRDKYALKKDEVRKKFEKSLRCNYYLHGREWPYKNVKPRIIAEKYMQDGNSKTLNVYKIFNFNGEPKLIQTIRNDKTKDEIIDYFDTEWNLLDLRQNYPNSRNPLPRPQTLQTMLELSKVLSQGVSTFLRTDFYEINGKVFFSEFTFYSDSGFAKFEPDDWDSILGTWINLPEKES